MGRVLHSTLDGDDLHVPTRFNVQAPEFGAKGDGTTDDTTAIQAAIDAAEAAGGGVAELPHGTYIVSDAGGSTALTLKPNVWLRGESRDTTTIKLADNADAHVISLQADVDRMMITDLTVDGNRANQSPSGGTHGIRLHGNAHLHLARLRVKEARYYGIGAGFTVGTEVPISDSRFEDIEIHNCGRPSDSMGDGFDLKRGLRCSFVNLYVHDNEQRGLDVRGRQHNYCNVWAYNNGSTGISLRALGDSADDDNFIQATNCYAFSNGAEGFILLNNESPITGWTARYKLTNCFSWENTSSGFFIEGDSMECELVSCTARANGARGFLIQDTDRPVRMVACDAIDNTANGGFEAVSTGAPMLASMCCASGNGGISQVHFAGPDSSWIGGDIDASDQTRGMTFASTATGSKVSSCRMVKTGAGTSADLLRVEASEVRVHDVTLDHTVPGTVMRLVSGGDNCLVTGCDFSGATTGTKVNNSATGTVFDRCLGITASLGTMGSDVGDAAATLTPAISEAQQIWSTDLTSDRNVNLSVTGAWTGLTWRIARPAGGAFNLNVGTGPLKALAAGEWCEVTFDGSSYVLTAFGSL